MRGGIDLEWLYRLGQRREGWAALRHDDGIPIGRFLQRAGIPVLPDRVIGFLVVHEGEHVGAAGPRNRGGLFGHRGNGTQHIGELIVLLRVKLVQENVGGAGAIGDVGQRLAVGGPLRVETPPALSIDNGDALRLEIEQ